MEADKRKKPFKDIPLSSKCQGYRERQAFEQKRLDVNKRGWEVRRVKNPPNGRKS